MTEFSTEDAVRFGWGKFKANWKFLGPLFLGVGMVNILLGLIPGWLRNTVSPEWRWVAILPTVVGGILQIFVGIFVVAVILKVASGQKIVPGEVLAKARLFLSYLAAAVLFRVITGLGFILLIVPGIILTLKLQFWEYFVVDKELGPTAALRESWRVTTGVKWQLFVFGLLLSLIELAGVLALGIGLLVTLPVTGLAMAYVYRKLSEQL